MKWILLIIMLFSVQSYGKTVRVAIIDTGIDLEHLDTANMCLKGHKSFVPNETIIDTHGHGTNIVGLIKKYAKGFDYCVIIIKFYSNSSKNAALSMVQSLEYALSLKPDIINVSAGGTSIIPQEKIIVDKILNSGIVLNVAAGNNFSNLDKTCNYFPACYDKRINVISAKDFTSANHGKVVDKYVSGKDQRAFSFTMTGTSQSTAIFTGDMLYRLGKR